ncbi:MAG: hypothetical protein ACD_3C00078G0001 [uncultured bacterium (gcode 4)]|uniref:Uncharacterized protein n=1 Tax=uncultured bacterium (gcode 4) TaxID=1234023 RepID=K2GDI5_9BACT|nr:MAG: hypothetical protein ACD_3C00078G0001 [uncultured bacterium (gcode 4)]
MMNPDLKPNNQRVGTSNSIEVIPFSVFMSFIIHFLFPSFSITVPVFDSGTITITASIGSSFLFHSSLKITWGHPTCNSNHSLLIVSIRTDKCNSHLPETINTLPSEPSRSTLRPTFISNSFPNLSLIFLEVTNLPSLPANGESLTRNSILRVGSSIVIGGIDSVSATVETVSQT